MSNNNNNNNAYGVGDLIQQNNKGKTLWMTVVVKRDLSYNSLLSLLRSNQIRCSSYSWNSSISYDVANYKRDRTSYTADLECVKTKSKEKPNPRYNLTILMSCVDQGEKRAFVHHDDDEHTQMSAMEKRGFYALGDARMDLQEQLRTANNRHRNVNAWLEYCGRLGLWGAMGKETIRQSLANDGLDGFIEFEMTLPWKMSSEWNAKSPWRDGATLEQQQAYIKEVEERGEFVNEWCGVFQKKFCNEFRLRNTMLHSDDYNQMFDDLKQVWAKHRQHPYNEASSYHHSAISQEYVFHHLGALIIEDIVALREKLIEIEKAQGHRGGQAEDELWDWWVDQRPQVKDIQKQFALTDRYNQNPSVYTFVATMTDEMLHDYAAVDRSVFDGPYLWDDTLRNAESVYYLCRSSTHHHHGVEDQDEWVDDIIISLGGSYSLWD